MLKPVNVNGRSPSVNWEPDRPTKPPGSGVAGGVAVGAAVGLGVGLAVGAAVGLGVGLAVGAAVGVEVGLAVGFGVAISVGVGVGVGVEPVLRTANVAAIAVVPPDWTIATLIECKPSATDDVFHGRAWPSDAVPAKSTGAYLSTCIAGPVIATLSSQKLAFDTPAVGVIEM
jgi:hypothetical protein